MRWKMTWLEYRWWRCHLSRPFFETSLQCVKERHSFERHSWAPLPKSGAKEECHSFLSKGAIWEQPSFFSDFSYFFIKHVLSANLYFHMNKGTLCCISLGSFAFLALFWAHVGQSLKFSQKNIENWGSWKTQFFLSRPFWFFLLHPNKNQSTFIG